jgi:hypothetical protein
METMETITSEARVLFATMAREIGVSTAKLRELCEAHPYFDAECMDTDTPIDRPMHWLCTAAHVLRDKGARDYMPLVRDWRFRPCKPQQAQAQATKIGIIGCPKCSGSGKYWSRPDCNGNRASGVCYHCEGKGHMTIKDQHRTSTYFKLNRGNALDTF